MRYSCVVSCPISTYSGYGARSRDLVKSLVEIFPNWDINIIPQRWGSTRQTFLEDENDTFFTSRIIKSLDFKPDIWIQVTIPNEFQPIGTYNIGVTAGIEATLADSSWIIGCNKMDLILVSSEFAKIALHQTKYSSVDPKTQQITGYINLETPLQTVFEGVDIENYKPLNPDDIKLDLNSIPEEFCFLTVGHWMQGDYGHDRKNIGLTVKTFLETFKNKQTKPALILKTSQATSSIIDKYKLLSKIEQIKKTVKGDLPNVYILHGDLSDNEMNQLYNHTKVKALISLTKGEGYGRPLAEFALTNKPVIASNWSGHLDFLKPDLAILINGKVEKIHKSAIVSNILIQDAEWFSPSTEEVMSTLRSVFKEYRSYNDRSIRQGTYIRDNFNREKMKTSLYQILEKINVKKEVPLKLELPKLKRIH